MSLLSSTSCSCSQRYDKLFSSFQSRQPLKFGPQTKGRTLEEIEDVFAVGHTFTAWKVGKDVGKKTIEEVVGRRPQAGSVHSSDAEKEKPVATHQEEL